MNTEYLIEHISTQLNAAVYQYTKSGEFVCKSTTISATSPDAFYYSKLKKFMFSIALNNMPIIASSNNLIYSIVKISVYIFLIGPVRLKDHIHLQRNAPEFGINPDLISICNFQLLVQHLLFLNNLYSEKPISEEALRNSNIRAGAEESVKRHFSNIIFENQEVGRMHNPYDQELREISSIRNGDIEQLKKSWNEDFNGHYGILAHDNLRSIKNICIVVITLASRAAIEGGVSPEMAYSLSDSYIYKIEELSDAQTIQRLCRNAEYDYTQMVHEIKNQRLHSRTSKSNNPRIDQCKNYIFKHLHEKIHIRDIAEELEVNSNYLAEFFYKNEGMTIRDFIMQEKIKSASNLLMYSKYSYSEIATNLGFCSQSHFGKNFKNVTQLTPKQYRETYGVRDYIR